MLYFTYVISLEATTILILERSGNKPVLQKRKLRLREAKDKEIVSPIFYF